MDKRAKTSGRRTVFLSYPDRDAARVQAAFNEEIMRLLTKTPRDYVATADIDTAMAALTASAASSAAEPRDGDDVDVLQSHSEICAKKLQRPDLPSLLRHQMCGDGDVEDAWLLPEFCKALILPRP